MHNLANANSAAQPRRIASCASVLAIAAFTAGQAHAQCTPNPPQAGQPVACSGTTTGGYVITADNAPLTVTAGASVQNSGGDALSVSIPASSGSYARRTASITVAGSISASGGSGISVWSGAPNGVDPDYYGTFATVTVAAGGSVSGVNGIYVAQTPGGLSTYAPANVNIDNFGTITGTSGVALASGNGGYYSTFSITNEAGGMIGAIAGTFQTLTNNGTITGGTLSAITQTPYAYYASITNSGTITSNSTSATINAATYGSIPNSGTISNTGSGAAVANAFTITNQASGTISAGGGDVIRGAANGTLQLTNSGQIANTGGGQAVSGGNLNITNNAGGVISAGSGGTAINASTGLTLVNTGTINGNILAGSSAPAYSYAASTIDSSQGTINGNVSFGAGSNTLVATLKNGALQTGVTGTITGGTGANTTNTLQLNITTDAILANALVLPTNFTQLYFAPSAGTTLTLANGFTNPGIITFTGNGTLTSAANLSGNGQIVAGTNYYTSSTFNNTGTITSSNAGGAAAIGLSGYVALVNSGTITASGDGVTTSVGSVNNSGTITAGSTAINAFTGYGFANSGTITSTGGTALILSQSCTCSVATNSGLISGAQVGVNLQDGILVNTGTITSGGYGVALGYYGTIENQAGGVITGGTVAIGNPNGSPGLAVVTNAGTINGNVNLANSGFGTNSYYALTGGVLNGNLTLGAGDTLVADLLNTGSGAFAGITGTVSANNSNLVYNVGTSARVTSASAAGFTSVVYALSNAATLTLDTGGALTSTLGLAGTGLVILGGAVATTNAPAIQSQALPGAGGYSSAPTALTITNNGTLSVTQNNPNYFYGAEGAVMLGGDDVLINNGTITATQSPGGLFIGLAAVIGGQSITNTGTITGTGYGGIATGANVQGAQITINNSGTITSDQVGIYVANNTGGTAITNSRTIFGAQGAISAVGHANITNSGTIASSGGAGVYASSGVVANLAGGIITGAGDAINMGSGTISNAGTINGNVNINNALSGSFFPGFNPGIYIADGGTLNGNLSFTNYGNNELIETGSGFGVTGTIDGGPGTNYVGHLRTSSAAVTLGGALPAGFTQEFVVASGASTVVTTQGPATSSANIYVAGDGQIVNQANTSGGVYNVNYAFGGIYGYSLQLASFTNQANVGGIVATANSFANSGNIGSLTAAGSVSQIFNGALSFNNTGTIYRPSSVPYQPTDCCAPSAASIFGTLMGIGKVTNSGTIHGGLEVGYFPGASSSSIDLTNSGTITGVTFPGFNSASPVAVSVFPNVPQCCVADTNGATVNFTNTGTITGDIDLFAAHYSLIDAPGGSITGNIFVSPDWNIPGSGAGSVIIAGAFSGNIDGGSGTTSLAVSGGSAATPVVFGTLGHISTYTQTGGDAVITGTANLGGVSIIGGALTGLVGSTINAPLITVGAGGMFASGGTVSGNIMVNGTLRAGASPDTLTVNGNVILTAGSTSVFEVTPTMASKLIASGSVTIAPGATLQIAMLQPVMPGTTLDLIAAGGGVSGSFSGVTGIAGKLSQQAGNVSVLVLFNTAGMPEAPQVLRAVTYLNNALAGGNAPAALMAALPLLTAANGAPAAQAFARTTPEPYASATQIGVESGLTLSATARDLAADQTMHSGHLFAFGQGLSDWRGMEGSAPRGTSGATINGNGFLGGLGVNLGPLSVAAYGGYLRQTQNTANLAASTVADGFVGGITARLSAGRAHFTLSAIHDAAAAKTTRQTTDRLQTGAGYRLHGLTIDGEAATSIALGKGWVAQPHLGTTWVWTQRAAASETSNSIFALSVAGDDHTAGFADGGLRLQTSDNPTARFSRFLDLGVRWQLQGRSVQALGGFADQPVALLARGARRSPLGVMLSSGGTYRATEAVSLFLSGGGEMTQGGNSAHVAGGIRVSF